MITLSQLAIYPIKSTAQISLQEAHISPFGLEMDRRWMLIDEKGVMLTQRKFARMCLIQSEIGDNTLSVSAPDMQDLSIATDRASKTIEANVWNDTCNAQDCGDEAASWFSDFLKTPARLVFFPQNEIRQVDLDYAQQGDITAFSDGFPYLLISQASLDDLNAKLDSPVSMSRFRPNLVVTGTDAFAEDSWKRIRIGDITFKLVKPCSRCVIPSIDPLTAEKSAAVVKTLSQYRMHDHKIFFGQNIIAEGQGELIQGTLKPERQVGMQVGMQVEILE